MLYNHRWLQPSSPSSIDEQSSATLYGASATITRVEITVPRRFHWRAGQHVFVTFPTVGWNEAHPFSIANLCCENKEAGKDGKKIVLYVKVKRGLTKRLFELVRSHKRDDSQVEIPAIIDGPYGMLSDFGMAETVMLIAGELLLITSQCP
jgi:predicted ferric reductase